MDWFCEIIQFNCTDLTRAISDVGLQLNATSFFLIILFLLGIFIGWFSHRLFHRQRRVMREDIGVAVRAGLRLRLRHSQSRLVSESSSWWSDFAQGISTEFFGAVVTTVLLGLGILVFEQYQDIQNLKTEIIFQMGSHDNALANEAIRRLDSLDWLENGTLRYVRLVRADLQDANLFSADLQGSNLAATKLQSANLMRANLQDTVLSYAKLQRAWLMGTNLQRAYLGHADLEDVSWQVTTNGRVYTAILPDGNLWTPETDMERFTNPNHPNYWNPCIEVKPTPLYCDNPTYLSEGF
jgi:hypothetical protein